jgi:hypothetical protein
MNPLVEMMKRIKIIFYNTQFIELLFVYFILLPLTIVGIWLVIMLIDLVESLYIKMILLVVFFITSIFSAITWAFYMDNKIQIDKEIEMLEQVKNKRDD